MKDKNRKAMFAKTDFKNGKITNVMSFKDIDGKTRYSFKVGDNTTFIEPDYNSAKLLRTSIVKIRKKTL